MKYQDVIKGIFIERPNRFIAFVQLGNDIVKCHVKNTGRCRELLVFGAKVILEPSQNPDRKTKYSLVAVYKNERLINIDSQAPNKVVFEALKQGKIFDGVTCVKPEYKYHNSRFDFLMEKKEEKWFIEVKGVTLERDGVVLFPDAPTQRGVKHLNELIHGMQDGYFGSVIFVIQMEGVKYFKPNIETHPQFGKTLRAAKNAGVKIFAYDCIVSDNAMEIGNPVNVIV